MGLDPEQLSRYRAACRSLRYWLRLTSSEGSVIAALTGGGTVFANRHYPEDDVIDAASGAQFYYHCHRGEEEHGHLHLYLRAEPGADLTHLIAISLDPRGLPVGFFTVNRWVARDAWLPAAATLELVDRFHFPVPGQEIELTLGRWLTHFLRFYRPVVAALLRERDARLEQRAQFSNLEAALDDRDLEIPSSSPIDWSADLAQIQRPASSPGRTRA
jgi:hypothetical protein